MSTQPEGKKRNIVFILILSAMLITGIIFGIKKYTWNLHHVSTDDAQIEQNFIPVISKISGYIYDVKIKDNQFVKKGDTLLIIDQRDVKMVLADAEAALATAKSNLLTTHANTTVAGKNINTANAAIGTIDAQINSAKVNVWRTTQDLKRYENLISDHSITQQQYEQALAAKQTADRQLQILEEQKIQAQAQTNVVTSQANATAQQITVAQSNILQRQVAVDNAKTNLAYTIILAPENGYVSKIPIQNGQFIQAGAQLFSLVQNNEKWVVANFKETQLSRMLEGQKVIVEADAFPKHKFEATITSFSPATGNKFSILPADNASGNFVKTVQRLPVKISFTKADSLIIKLRAGMNVSVDVSINNN